MKKQQCASLTTLALTGLLLMDQALAQGPGGQDFPAAEDNPEGMKVIQSQDDVPQPVAARYAWSNLPVGRLMNHLELPAYPFRTDDWPLTPHQSTGDYHRNLGK